MNARATIANSLWWLSNLPAWFAFRRALNNPLAAQTSVLQSIVRCSANTAFGKAHHFDQIHNVHQFRSQVPLRDYHDFEPWITRIRNGEAGVLTPERVKRLATTSGTTTARKLIPYTNSLQADFNRAIGPWITDLFHQHPSLMTGTAYWSISPVAQPAREESAVPIGFEEDSEYLGGIRRLLVDAVMAVLANVRHAPTVDQWREQTIRHLNAASDLRLISIWHPSFLKLLLEDCPTPPNAMWPSLQLISCWGDGRAESSFDQLREQFPNVSIQAKGLIATEAIVSIPFAGQWSLAIRSHYFEFANAAGDIYGAHELEVGKVYEVIVTTSGGLFSYRLRDQVRVEAMIARTPSIRFVGKIGGISDLFGEKLSEAFVSDKLKRISVDCACRWRFAILAPAQTHYTVFVEGEIPQDLSSRLDQALRENPQYAYCRDLNQLKSPRVFHIAVGGSTAFTSHPVSLGQRLGDIKPVALSLRDDWDGVFPGIFA